MSPTTPPQIPNPFFRTPLAASCLAIALMIQGPLCQAANYYVDSAVASDGIGTEAQPWKSLTKVNSMTFGPGDTIHFKRGGYWVGILDPKSCQGNSSARMVFRDYGDEEDPAPLLQGLNANEPVVRLDSPSYFTIQNFKITHPGATEAPRSGIYVHFWGDGNAAPGGSYLYRDVEIKNNEITDVTGLTSRTNGNNYSVGAIFVEFHDNNSSRVKVDGLLIDGNFIHDTRCLSIQFRPASNYSAPLADPVAAAAAMELWADNVVIRNNIMARTGGDHILVQGADAPLIENNAGYDAGINAVQDGNLWQAGMWVCFHTRNSLFQYNEVARTVNPLINNGDSQAFDVDYGTWGSHIFQYNYTHDNAGGVLIMMPRQIVNGQPDTRANLPKTVVFRYNVSANDGRNTLSQCQLGISPRVGVNSAHIHNNVFFTTRAEGLRFPEVEASFYTNNIFHAPSATYASKAVFSNNAYFGHTPVVEDPYKITADPLMAGPFPTGPAPDALINGLNIRDLNAPYKLQTSSPLINRGKPLTVPVALPAEDFWGYPLFQGNIDIGAHEAGGGSNPRPQAVYYTDNTDPSVLAVGAWTQLMDVDAYDGTRLSSSTPGDAVEFTFSGTTVALYGRTGPNMGQLAISHNGGPTVQTVNCYSSALKHRVKLYETNSVASGTTNTLRATVVARGASSSGDNVGIDYIVSTGGPGTVQLPDPVSVELDTESPGVTFLPNAAAWMSSRSVTGYYGTDYRHDGATAATVAKSVQFTPTLPFTATYKVYVRWPMANNYASNATFTVNHASGAVPFTINQRLNGGGWVLLGSYPFAAGTSGNVTVSNTGANGHVIADGVKFVTAAPQTEPVTVDNPPVANLPAFAVSYTPVASWNHSADPTFYNGTKSVANIAGQFVEFKFTGTKASLYVKKASSLGRLKIFVNGTLMTTVDCYSPTVVNQFKIYETPVLPNQLNTLKAVIEFKNPSSTGNYIGIDKFEFQP